MRTEEHDTLTAALGVRPRELVSLVGGGGKTGALQRLAREAAGAPALPETGCHGPGCAGACPGDAPADSDAGRGPRRVVATTTTAMFLREMQAVGPVLMGPDRSHLLAALPSALAGGGAVAVARDLAEEGKVAGLPVDWVDALWKAGEAGLVIVEADGSRSLPLKAFGAHEPQAPETTTLVVQVAGLDVLGAPLDGRHIHRVDILLAGLAEHPDTAGALPDTGRIPKPGEPVTPALVIAALRLQLRHLRRCWPAARIVTLLNKAEDEGRRGAALQVARDLLEPSAGGVAPEAVVAGSVREGAFTRCTPDRPLVSAVVLAAGLSRRMGVQKVLLPVDGRPMVERVAAAAARSRAAETIVVAGADADAVRASVSGHQVRVICNPDYERGMSTSLRAGLAAARPDAGAVLFALGDQPFLTPAVIDRLIARFVEKGSGIVRAAVEGEPAHPVLIGAEYFDEVMALEGDVGAREILERHAGEVSFVDIGDPRAALDVDTRADYEAAGGR